MHDVACDVLIKGMFFLPFSNRARLPQQPWLISGSRYACRRKSQERRLALIPCVTTSSRRPRSDLLSDNDLKGWHRAEIFWRVVGENMMICKEKRENKWGAGKTG